MSRDRQITLFCILYACLCTGLGLRRVNESDEYKLRRELFENMDVMVRPVTSYSDAVGVSFSLTVRSLNDLANKRQVLITSVWITQRWHNPFLEWDRNKFGGLDRIHVSPKEIWVPDIILYNNGDNKVYQAGHTEFFKTWVVLQSNGTCLWETPANIESDCNVEISSFPFDIQNCSLIFVSATYGSEELVVYPMSSNLHPELNETGEWKIISTFEEVFIKGRQRLSDQRNYSFIKITLLIERKWMYYVMFLIMPCVICTLLVLVGFSIPPENGERIGFCSTIMIAVSVFLLLIADMLPEKSDTLPVLGVYYIITMLLIAFALMATILVLRAYHSVGEPPSCFKALYRVCKSEKKKQKPVKRNAVSTETNASQTQPCSVHEKPVPDGVESGSVSDKNDDLSEEEKKKIWRSVAVIFDRLFFWLFLMAFICSSGYLIAFRPVFKLFNPSGIPSST
ncbi:neuronal acetylcholine receptor subunit alpha-5-like [Montipora capricornis]|uniref:neuronal acetylcholine receptor subunit alpha-5-like n=1 Tax=Montipora capricornis TaxID=246305 RepID=UPI0035F1BD7D